MVDLFVAAKMYAQHFRTRSGGAFYLYTLRVFVSRLYVASFSVLCLFDSVFVSRLLFVFGIYIFSFVCYPFSFPFLSFLFYVFLFVVFLFFVFWSCLVFSIVSSLIVYNIYIYNNIINKYLLFRLCVRTHVRTR